MVSSSFSNIPFFITFVLKISFNLLTYSFDTLSSGIQGCPAPLEHCVSFNLILFISVLLTLGAHAQRGLQYLVCHSVCLSVCLSVRHAILAVRATKSITKDAIVLCVRFAAILKWRFS